MVTTAESIRDESLFPLESRTSEKTASTFVFSTMIQNCFRGIGWCSFCFLFLKLFKHKLSLAAYWVPFIFFL